MRWAGSTSCDSTSEKTRHGMTISGMTRMILPMIPSTVSRGKKAATVVRDDDTTGASMRMAPPSAAISEFSPYW